MKPQYTEAIERELKEIVGWLQSKIDSYVNPSNAMEQSERWAYICARDYINGRLEDLIDIT
jgi:hypothetical protein